MLESHTTNHWLAGWLSTPRLSHTLYLAACLQLKVTQEAAGSLLPWARCGQEPDVLDSVLTEQCGEGAPYTDVQDNRRIWRGRGRPQRASPLLRHPDLSHPALYAFSSVFCLTATPPLGSLIQVFRTLAQIQRTQCPAHKHLGSYSVRGPKLGHNEDKMSQAVSLEHPILWGWQICKHITVHSDG